MTEVAPAAGAGAAVAGVRARIVVDGRPVEFEAGDSVAVAIIRSGEAPARGGTLCLAGDCGNCLAQVDGIAYVRTCQTAARPGMRVARHPAGAMPALSVVAAPDPTATPLPARIKLHHVAVDVAVLGGGPSGRAAAAEAEGAGKSVRVFDAGSGEEVVAIYAGPMVVVRTPEAMVHVHPNEIVIATGAAEIHPVCPGNRLAGIVTARAAERLHAAGVDLGRVVAIGTPPAGVPATLVDGRLLRFEGDAEAGDNGAGDIADGRGGANGSDPHGRPRRVRAVVTTDSATGAETITAADTVVVGLGLAPRDLLARMAGTVPVTIVGEAADDLPLPTPPTAGVVCGCMGTTVADLEQAWDRGFTELELLKRASQACLGTCQGGACLPNVRAWIAGRTSVVPDPFTARPASRQITLGEASADTYVDAFRRTPLHDEHIAAGARMDRFGGWWRPWHYGDAVAEYWAVREAVSIGDVSTLGKLVVSGPDVVELLERLYPCHVADIKPGRSRYALLLNERGHVMDDGMILRDSETRFVLSFTSGGAANAEMWVRDWIDVWGLAVHVLDRTMSLAAINVTGPLAATLLDRAGLMNPPRFLGHTRAEIAGVPCHVMRLSFTGEAAFELHHPIDRSVELWRALMALGSDLGIRPHGLQALFGLRLEKGHVIVGMDTELDTTPRRIGMDWAVRMEKPRFIGRAALERTAKLDDQRRWLGFSMDGPAPTEGSPIWSQGEVVGNVTGSWRSPSLGKALILGWLRRKPFPDRVEIDGREAVVTATPFYDPEGHRARA